MHHFLRFTLSFLCFFVLFIHLSFAQINVQSIANHPVFKNASLSFYAVNLNSGKEILNYDGTRLLTPASTTKLFSTAMALEVLGTDFQATTKLFYTGQIKDHVLEGDLWIIGGGDMTLGSKYFHSDDQRSTFLSNWVQSVTNLGIQKINGSIYVDGSDFGYHAIPDEWIWGDIGNYYGAFFSGIVLYDNLIEYHFQTEKAGSLSQLKYTFPTLPTLQFDNHIYASTKRGDNSYIYGAPYLLERKGRGFLPQYQFDFVVKGSLPDPEKQLSYELETALKKQGIELQGKSCSIRNSTTKRPTNWIEILSHKGKTVADIIQKTNHESINLFAEGLMRLTAYHKNQHGEHQEAVDYMRDFWNERLTENTFFFFDGSGLSRANAISAKSMCQLLSYMHHSDAQQTFYESLPISGVSGTMRYFGRSETLKGKIHAKSGSMKHVRSYAGYINSNSGDKIAFALIVNNYHGTSSEAKHLLEQVAQELVKQ